MASFAENFQFFSGFSMRSRKRFFCSFFETCRKNFSTTMPLRARYCSKSRMSSKRSFQMSLVTSCGRQLLLREELRVHADDERLLVVAAIEDPDAAALRQALHAAPQVVVVEVLAARRLEREDLAALRVHARHHVLDRAVLAGRVHRLEDQQHRPAVLRVELVLEFREHIDAQRERFLRLRLRFVAETERVARIDLLEPEFAAVGDSEGLCEGSRAFDQLFRLHRHG